MSLRGHYAEALSEYFHAYRFLPKEPLVLLSIGVGYLSAAMTKGCSDKHRAVLNGFAFVQVRACVQSVELEMKKDSGEG